MNPRHHVAELLDQAVAELKLDLELELADTVESTQDRFGDFASNLALRAAPKLKIKPPELAGQIADRLSKQPDVVEAAVAGPGFINIRLSPKYWLEYANDLLASAKPAKPNGKSVNVEFVSANPTGPLVLVNAWQAYYGDILARIFARDGWRVEREYYSNDTGNQILNLGKSILAANGAKFSEEEVKQFYKGGYIQDLAARLAGELGGQTKLAALPVYDVGRQAAAILFDGIKASFGRMNVHYDRFFSENDLDNDATLELLRSKNAVVNHDEAVWLKADIAGGEQDRVLVRSGGKGATYFLKDISYQLNRLTERKYDLTITITGADHHGEMLYLKQTLAELGYANFQPLSTQMVRLIEDGHEVKMSKRAGKYILLDEFLDLVPSDVARFYFGMRDTNSHFDFDLTQAQEQTKNNPMFYCMYAYARSCSILEKAKSEAIAPAQAVTHDLAPTETALVKQAAHLEQTITAVADNYKVHSVLHEFIELCSLFHDYYEQERILALQDAKLQSSKLALLSILANYFENIFELLGITPQQKM